MKIFKSALPIAVCLTFLFLTTTGFAADKAITLATLEWEPYVGADMPKNGFSAEIVVAAFKRTGYAVKIEFHPWTKTLEIGKAGQVDGIFPAYRTAEREVDFLFSEPFAESPLGFYKKSSAVAGPNIAQLKRTDINIVFSEDPRINPTAVLKDLADYRFGVVEGYANTPEFDAADYLTKVTAKTDAENLLNLINGRVDLIFIDRYVAKTIIVKRFPWHLQDYEFMTPALANKPLFAAFPRSRDNHQKLQEDFNRGLAIAIKDGMIQRLYDKYGLKSRF